MVSASRIGFSSAPESMSPILRITSLLSPVALGSSWAIALSFFVDAFNKQMQHLARGYCGGFDIRFNIAASPAKRMSNPKPQ
jgi:hypothetical protein